MSLYNDLGIKEDASKGEIKKAHRSLAKKYHPDKEGGNNDKFIAINKAYTILIDDVQRARYDETGETVKPDIDKQAIGELAKLFQSIIDNNDIDLLENKDIVLFMQGSIKETIKNIEKEIKKIGKDEKRLMKFYKRIKHKKDKGNIFDNIIIQKKKRLIATARLHEENVKMWNIALQILKEYDDTIVINEEITSFRYIVPTFDFLKSIRTTTTTGA